MSNKTETAKTCQFKHGKFKCEQEADKETGLCKKHWEKYCKRCDKAVSNLIIKALNNGFKNG